MGDAILHRVVREILSLRWLYLRRYLKKVRKGRKQSPEKGKSKGRVTKAWLYLTCLRNSEEASLPAGDWTSERMIEDEAGECVAPCDMLTRSPLMNSLPELWECCGQTLQGLTSPAAENHLNKGHAPIHGCLHPMTAPRGSIKAHHLGLT